MTLGDALIAGTAISPGLRVVTHNTDDFDWIEGLDVFDPLVN
jgi:predicted nucleic acid-binding protein